MGKNRNRTSDGLTKILRATVTRQTRVHKTYMDKEMPYPTFEWAQFGSQECLDVIEDINEAYRKMLSIGKAQQVCLDKGSLSLTRPRKTSTSATPRIRGPTRQYSRIAQSTLSICLHRQSMDTQEVCIDQQGAKLPQKKRSLYSNTIWPV